MRASVNIIEAVRDKRLLGHYFKDVKSWGVWLTVLKALFSLPFTAEDWPNWKRIAGERPLPEKVKELWVVAARRLGKTTIMAVVAVFLGVFKKWNEHLSAGERGHIICIAVDRKQAGELFRRIRHTFALPFFRQLMERETLDEIWLKNGIVIAVKTADFRSIRGLTIVAALLDEAAFYRVEGRNPFAELLVAVRPGMATIPDSLLIVVSSPYMKAGPLWETYRKYYGKNDPHVLVVQGSTELFNPTLNSAFIRRQIEQDPEAGKAEWLGHFRDDLEMFLDKRMLDAVVIPDRAELPPVKGIPYHLFADPSGGKSDSFTAAVSHKEAGGIVVLDVVREWRPPFKPVEVVKQIAELAEAYSIKTVVSDKYAGEWVGQAFRDAGLEHEPSPLNKSELYLELIPAVAGQRVELLDNSKMLAQLRGLERRTRSGGHDLVDHGPGAHDDLANVCAGAIYLASQGDRHRGFAIASQRFLFGPHAENSGIALRENRVTRTWDTIPAPARKHDVIMMGDFPKRKKL